MHKVEHIGTDRETERELYLLDLSSPDDFPTSLNTCGKYSTVLLAWDATNVEAAQIASLAQRLIEAGAVYFCTWGSDCERVHDIIDEQWVGDTSSITNDPTLMTTWHAHDTLDEAIWFALYAALPIDKYFDDCRSVIAVCIGNSDWAATIRSAFVDTRRFNELRPEG